MKGTNTKTKKDKQKLKYHIHVDGREFKVYETRTKRLQIHSTSFGKAADGTYIKRKFEADTLTELQEAVEDFINELNGKAGANLTFYNACLHHIEMKAALSPTARNAYRRLAGNRFECLHDKPIRKLTRQDFFEAVTAEAQKGISQKTMKNALTLLFMVCDESELPVLTAKLKKELQRYGAIATKGNKGRKANEDWENAPSACEVAKWAGENTTDTADRTAISILLDLHSLRSEETRGLQYREVFEDNGKCYINICRTRTVMNSHDCEQETTKNDCSTRKILIDRRLYDLIRSQPHQSENDYVINVSNFVYSNSLKRVIHSHTVNGHSLAWVEPHTLRHIFKTEHIGNPVAIKVGGWTIEGGVSERVYTHIKQKDMDELMFEYSKKLLDSYEGITEPSITVTAGAAGTAEKSG